MLNFILHIAISLAGAVGLAAFIALKQKNILPSGIGILAFATSFFVLFRIGDAALPEWRMPFLASQSILGSGTATLSAVLYIVSRIFPKYRRSIYQFFLVIYKIIWLGIAFFALDTIYVGIRMAGFQQILKFVETWPPFIFEQILFATLILNGVYIGKSIGRGIIMLTKEDPVPSPARGLMIRIAASGSFSIVSWYSLLLSTKGMLDGFTVIQLLIGYAAFVLAVFAAVIVFEKVIASFYTQHAESRS